MAKKNKKKSGPKTPSLSSLDRCIYYVTLLLLVVVFFLVLLLPIGIFRDIVFSDPDIIAAMDRGEVVRWPFFFYVLLSAFIFVVTCYEELLALKEAVPPDRIFYTGHNLERYLRSIDPTPSERDLLNKIFQMNEERGEVP